MSDNGFQQMSFVNSIATTKGGRHVDYVSKMIENNVAEVLKKKNKGGVTIKPHQIRYCTCFRIKEFNGLFLYRNYFPGSDLKKLPLCEIMCFGVLKCV